MRKNSPVPALLAAFAVWAATAACGGPAGLLPGVLPGLGADQPGGTPSPTAFGPVPPTSTGLPTATATPTPAATPTSVDPWGSFPGPSELSPTEIPREAPRIATSDGIVNVLLLGNDYRPAAPGLRTDTMMIASLNPEAGTVTLVSFPRDLYVYQPGFRVDRINTAFARGGPDLTKLTFLYNFGVEIDYYVLTDFTGFMSAVDTLGGIDVQVRRGVTDRCGRFTFSYAAGTHHMDGFTALCYARMRKYSSDFARLGRQQEVIVAIFRKILSLNGLARLPELYSQLGSTVRTDLGLADAIPLVPLAVTVSEDASRIQQFEVGTDLADGWITPTGAAVQLPHREEILAMLLEALGP
jgi:LCP family protein required for cell wall assembly